jgi:beta-galactosidase
MAWRISPLPTHEPFSQPFRNLCRIPHWDDARSLSLTLLFLFVSFFCPAASSETNSPRERTLLDFGWKFHLGNSWGTAQNLTKAGTGSGPASLSFSDASWRPIDLPHDWAIELPFNANADASHGFKALGTGFPENSVAWYRRSFDLPQSDSGKRIWLEFDGVFRDAVVFVNGWTVGHHESGYSSFRYDITDVANYGGRNVVVVKVDATQPEGWFFEGAGVYRHVWLVKTSPLAIAPDGTFVRAEFNNNIPNGPAGIHIQTRLMNQGNSPAEALVEYELINPDGKSIRTTKRSATLKRASTQTIDLTITVPDPVLWSPESPSLYHLITTLTSKDGVAIDRTETEFGIRTVAFDVTNGFLLNGKPYVLKGTCNHQDHAGVGAALPDGLQYFRIAKLKEMGCNAYRTSHNPPTPELLTACDRLGMLVMDENRLLGSDAQNLERLERQVLRDRNHPGVAIWSIANEEFSVQGTPIGQRVAQTMQGLIKRLDPSRPITYAAPVGNDFWGINSVIEVRGWNYHVGAEMDDYHKAHPTQPNVGSEQGSTVSTRGIYANDAARGYVSAYDDNAPSWAHTAETWWSYFAVRPWLSGGFVWTGFDYRGEPTPYGWPCINSHFGILDTCGFPKDNFWYYQSWWTTNVVLHLLPHWNWPGKEGQEIDVRALSNCEEVELFLNGSSLGRQPMKRNSELRWKVKYAPGVLSAKGFKAGQQVAETKVETTGEAASVRLTPDRVSIKANGQDVSVITVAILDANGHAVPTASNLVHFELEGRGKILGVGNGDPSCHEPDTFLPQWHSHSKPVEGDWKLHRIADPYKRNPPEVATDFDDSSWAPHNIQSDTGPLNQQEHAVFRCRFALTDQDLANEAVELQFGMIDEEGWVYINGKEVGESHDWQISPSFDVKAFLHPGTNTVAVVVANNNGAGGLNRGATLQMREAPTMPHWQRSTFNGLAQLIVQSSATPGQVRLAARSDGLAPSTVTLQTTQ